MSDHVFHLGQAKKGKAIYECLLDHAKHGEWIAVILYIKSLQLVEAFLDHECEFHSESDGARFDALVNNKSFNVKRKVLACDDKDKDTEITPYESFSFLRDMYEIAMELHQGSVAQIDEKWRPYFEGKLIGELINKHLGNISSFVRSHVPETVDKSDGK